MQAPDTGSPDEPDSDLDPVSVSVAPDEQVVVPIAVSETKDTVQRRRNPALACLRTHLMLIYTVSFVILGVVLGFVLRRSLSNEDYILLFYLRFPGAVLLNMILMLVVPLIMTSLVTGITSVGSATTRRLGCAASLFYLSTTFMASCLGILLVVTVQPGARPGSRVWVSTPKDDVGIILSVLDIISQCFPENMISAMLEKVITKMVNVTSVKWNETSNSSYTVEFLVPQKKKEDGTNILGLVVFSFLLGFAINYVGHDALVLRKFFQASFAVVMALMSLLLLFLPVGVMFLIAHNIVSAQDVWQEMASMGKFMGVVAAGTLIHGAVLLPCLYFFLTGKNPYRLAVHVMRALCTALSTSSSSATLPVTMDCLINECGLSASVVKFVVPIGATINMDGTALYEAVAAIYVAQMVNRNLSIVEIVVVSLTATVGAVGAAGIPEAGLGTLVIVLTSVGLPLEDAMILLSIDWICDRMRTVCNVWGDCVGAAILDHQISKHGLNDKELAQPDLNVPETTTELSGLFLSTSSVSNRKYGNNPRLAD